MCGFLYKYSFVWECSFILTWHRGRRDQEGGSLRMRPLHCTLLGLRPAISPNVGNSGAQFMVVGVCVRAAPVLFISIQKEGRVLYRMDFVNVLYFNWELLLSSKLRVNCIENIPITGTTGETSHSDLEDVCVSQMTRANFPRLCKVFLQHTV